MEILEYDLAIVGAGPAGLTAAIYARRANLSVVFLDKDAPGGKVVTTATVENYPGFEEIGGPELAMRFLDQATKLGAKFIFSEVLNIDTQKDQYRYVELANGKVIKAKAVIIATGMVNRKLSIPGEAQFTNRGVSWCAICDGAFYKDQPVVVIGSGRSAVEESVYLSDIASHVTLISNKAQFKAEKISIDHLNKKNNITVHFQHDTISFNGKEKLESVTVRDQVTQETRDIHVNGAFIFIGFLPVAPKVDNASLLDEETHFIIVDSAMKTKKEGVFAAGDITTKNIRQISTAISDGGIAALSAAEYINCKEWK